MTWYTSIRNCINHPKVDKTWSDSIIAGGSEVLESIFELTKEYNNNNNERKNVCVMAIDGFYGINWTVIIEGLQKLFDEQSLKIETININDTFKSIKEIERYIKPYLTDDLFFGRVCNRGFIGHLMDSRKIDRLKNNLRKTKRGDIDNKGLSLFIVYGPGAAISELIRHYDYIFYFDITREHLLRQVWEKGIIPFGSSELEPIFWKRLYYVDYPLLIKQKKYVFRRMNFYVEANNFDDMKLIPKESYDGIISTMVKNPIKLKRVFMPGPWGGYKFRDYFNLPELPNAAWNTAVSGMDSSLIIDVDIGSNIEIPFFNLYMQYPVEVVGPYINKKYPGLFPLQVGLDDGYFPEPVSSERSNMPIHLHPDTNYVKKNFNEPLGRYEVYYIVEAYDNAKTMHGFYENADIEEFKERVLDGEEKGIKFNWTKYVKEWPSKAGDLYLIPAGTAHGTGGNQLVLEMDTCPSITGTEYSFFLYDFLRHTWDEATRTMTGKPMKLQIKHGLSQCRWNRKEKWVAENLRPKARIVRSGNGWSEEQFDSYYPMPYHIERLNFEKKMESDTRGRFVHFLCLTKGDRAKIRSKKNPEIEIELEYIQSVILPAYFGEYECINIGNNSCTLTRQRWKRG